MNPDHDAAPASPLAAALRGSGPAGWAPLVAMLLAGNLAGAALALLWVRLSRTPWQAVGLRRAPRPWLTAGLGVVAGVTLKFAMKALVMPLLGAPAENGAYAFVAGDRGALARMLLLVIIGAGFGEELLWRGVLFERLGIVFGRTRGGRAAILALTSGLFGLAHLSGQGVPGAEQGALMGIVFGAMVLVSGDLWLAMATHAAFDVTALLLIFFRLEARVAHSLMR